jgi:hypothetical protein
VPDPTPRMSGSTTESDLKGGRPQSPRASSQPEPPEETQKESGDIPITIEHDPLSAKLGVGPSSLTFIMVPRNPFTTVEFSGDAESQSDSAVATEDQAIRRSPPAPCPPPLSSQASVHPEAQRLWEAVRSSGLTPDTEVRELANIGQRLAE